MKRTPLILGALAVGSLTACLGVSRPDTTAADAGVDAPTDAADGQTGDSDAADSDGGDNVDADGGCTGQPCTTLDEVACADDLTLRVCTEVVPGCRVWVDSDCDDGRDCTDDQCVPAFGCANELRGGTCLIEGTCYVANDTKPGSCLTCLPSRNPIAWSPNDAECPGDTDCKVQFCAADTGSCLSVNAPAASPCAMDDACTTGFCNEGTCQTTPIVCDPLPCQTVTCDADSGCSYAPEPDGTACDDGDVCTAATCDGNGVCVGTPKCDECFLTGDCNPTTGACTGGWNAQACGCQSDSSLCAFFDGPCTTGVCAGEVCIEQLTDLGAPCDDGDPCTGDGTCGLTGVCESGLATDCDDNLACTVDICLPGGGCSNTPMTGYCVIDGECIAPGAVNPANPCHACTPADPDEWTVLDAVPCDDGDACTIEDSCVQGSCNGVTACGERNVIFVTSATVSGVFTSDKAKEMCETAAMNGGYGYPEAFWPWVVFADYSPLPQLASFRGWDRPDNLPVADALDDLVAGRLLYPPSRNELGTTLHTNAWVGASDADCNGWSSDTGAYSGRVGRSSGGNQLWQAQNNNNCNQERSIYCVEGRLQVAVPPSAPPPTARLAFVTDATWIPGGGLAGADALCQSEANAASLAGTFKALLASNDATAASRFDTGTEPWFRPDGVKVWGSPADLATPNHGLLAPITVLANGDHAQASPRAWTGATTPTEVGTPEQTCDNWTSADPYQQGWNTPVGYSEASWFLEFAGGTPSCETGRRLFCLQE